MSLFYEPAGTLATRAARLLALPCLLALLGQSAAHANLILLNYDSTWSYNQTTNLDNAGWQLPGFNDAAWPVGPGLFYFGGIWDGTPRKTMLAIGRTTYYFRKAVYLPVEPTNVVLSFSAKIDDGAVFYVNGQEMERVRMPQLPVPIAYNTLATSPSPGGTPDLFAFSGNVLTNFVKGTNTLAVEVHQDSYTSGDLVFGTTASVIFTNSPPVFVDVSPDVTAIDGGPAQLIAWPDGDPVPARQWYKDGVAIPGATSGSLFFARAYPKDAGAYQLEATNVLGRTMSPVIQLTVLADETPPEVLQALAQKDLTSLQVYFSEEIERATLTDTNNYKLFQSSVPTNRLRVLNAVAIGNSGVVLTTEPRTPLINYTLELNGIRDTSSRSNMVPANTQPSLRYKVDLVAADANTIWQYSDGSPVPTNWSAVGFVPTNWLSGAGVFAAGAPLADSPDPVRTILPLNATNGAFPTYYFRTAFDLPGPVETNSLTLRAIADDGAVLYLNGNEMFSVGMPGARPVLYTNRAYRVLSPARYEPPLSQAAWAIVGTSLVRQGNLFAAEVHQSTFDDVAFAAQFEATVTSFYPKLQLELPATVLEGSGTLLKRGSVVLLEPLATNLIFHLTSSDPTQLEVSPQVTIPAGSTKGEFDFIVRDNLLVDGPQLVTITAQTDGLAPTQGFLQVLDDETNVVSLSLPDWASETNATVTGEIRFSQPAVTPVTVMLASTAPAAVALPATVIMPAGATSIVVQGRILDDPLLNGPQTVSVSASVAGWTPGSATMVIEDNEQPTVTMVFPPTILEGAVLTNAGKISLGGVAVSNVVVTLASGAPQTVSVPAQVTVLSGQSSALFTLTAPDDLTQQPNAQITVTGSALGFPSTTNSLTVVDNDPHHIRFGPVPQLVDTNTGLNVELIAENADGSVQTNFALSVTLRATGLEGVLAVQPTNTGSFSHGRRLLGFIVPTPGRSVRLSCAEYPGQSEPFNCIPPILAGITQQVADIAWHETSQTLFASVPASASTYSNQLVAIDPSTGLVTNSYRVDFDPSQIEMSPEGTYMYVAVSNSTFLQRFDLATRTSRAAFPLGDGTIPLKVASDFCVPAGLFDAVVVALKEVGILRYSSGVPASLRNLTATGAWELESLPTPGRILLCPPLTVADANSDFVHQAAPNFWGSKVSYRDGRIYDRNGNFYSGTTLDKLGSYPGVLEEAVATAIVEVNPALRRVIYLASYISCGFSSNHLKVFDRDLQQLLLRMPIPSSWTPPTRMLRCGSFLAYINGEGQLWVIRPDAVQPSSPAAELSLKLADVPQSAIVNSNFTFSMVLSNAGPGIASTIRVTNAVPANTVVTGVATETGSFSTSGSGFEWYLGALPPGSNATLQVTLQFNSAGRQNFTAWALGFEADPIWTNNMAMLPVNVQLNPTDCGAFAVNCANEDLIYDPVQDRLLVSVGSAPAGQSTNGIAVLNPYTGIVESFTAMGKKPARLTRTSAGEYLYVSFPADRMVRRFTLPGLEQNLEFELGNVNVMGTSDAAYPADILALPGDPETLVIWRARPTQRWVEEFGLGIAAYRDGVVAPSFTDTGGNYQLELDSDTGTVYAFDSASGRLYRCSVGSDGVTNSPPLLPDGSLPGQYVRYARNRMFSTQGRSARLEPPTRDWRYLGTEKAALVQPDAVSGRISFLIQTNGWEIRVYDMDQGCHLGSLPVPYVQGTPSSLTDFGTNGLAFRTSSNQVYLVRSPLFQSLSADVAIGFISPSDPIQPGSNAPVTLSITNLGPNPSLPLFVTNSFSAPVTLTAIGAELGRVITNAGSVVWALPEMAPGTTADLSYTFSTMTKGIVTVTANTGSSLTPDTNPVNNAAVESIVIGALFSPDSLAVVQLAAKDMVWSPALSKLIISCGTNLLNWSGSLVLMNPEKLKVQSLRTLGMDAGPLALSKDESVLYAGVDYGISVLTIPEFELANRFLLNFFDATAYAYDLEVIPGSPRALLVGARGRSTGYCSLGIYDGPALRRDTQFNGASEFSLEFGDDPSVFYCQNHTGGFQRYGVDTNGLTLIETRGDLIPRQQTPDLKFANGLLYSSTGIVIEPTTRKRFRSIPGITNDAPVCYDSATRRVFYLMPVGSHSILSTIDAVTGVVLDSRLVSGYSGTPAGLLRWGEDGLAFLTSSGQIGIIRSTLIPVRPSVDLQIGLRASDPVMFLGSNFVYSIGITNASLITATNVQVSIAVPPSLSVCSATASQGVAIPGTQQVLANLGALNPGATAQVFVNVVATQPGIVVALTSITSSSEDRNLSDNSAMLTNSAARFVARNDIAVIKQSAAALSFNRLNGLLYASDRLGSVAVVEPQFAKILAYWPVPGEPGQLALSDDGSALYVSYESGQQLARLSTDNGTIVTNFALGPAFPDGSPLTLLDMEVIPGRSGSIVVRGDAEGASYLSILDDGVARANPTPLSWPAVGPFLEFADDPSIVYLSGLTPVQIFANDMSVAPGSKLFPLSDDFKYDRGCFFTGEGYEVTLTNRMSLLRFPGLSFGSLVVPETARQRVYFLTQVGPAWQVRAYDPLTTEIVGTQTITNVVGTPSAFLRWGDDGLAFCTTSDQLFLLRPWFVPGGGSADLQLTQIAKPAGPVSVGSNVTFSIRLTNAGPASADNVQISCRIPAGLDLPDVQLSQGTSSFSQGLLTYSMGTLTNGGVAQATVTVRSTAAGPLVSRATVTSANPDPNQSDNLAISSVGVQFELRPNSFAAIGLQTGDMVYDPHSGLLYASLTGYSGPPFDGVVVTIDPTTGTAGPPIQVGPRLSKLALTDDGSSLYALTKEGREFTRVLLPDGTPALSVPFSVATGEQESTANAISAIPGQPESLAVILQYPGLLAPGTPALVAYDNAFPRPDTFVWENDIEFFSTNMLLGTAWSYPARFELSANGFAVAQAEGQDFIDGLMAADAGLVYTTSGSVFDPMTLSRIRSFAVSGLVAPDSSVNRVCFMTEGSYPSKILRTFDQYGLRELPSLTITNVGAVEQFVRCGADRLAFRTSAGQIYIVRSSSIPTGPPADLGITLVNREPSPAVGQPLALIAMVTNLGPSVAPSVVVSNYIPRMAFVSAVPSHGSVATNFSSVIWQVGRLAPGEVATNRLVLVPAQSGAFSAKAVVWDDGITDRNGTNDGADTTWLIHHSPAPAALSSIALAAGEVIWDPRSGRLVLSAQYPSAGVSNTLLRLDPVTGRFDPPLPTWRGPGKLALSDDGSTLYVGQETVLTRMEWPSGLTVTNYPFGGAVQIELSRVNPNLMVVMRPWSFAAYLNGDELPLDVHFWLIPPTTLTRPDAAGRFYGYVGDYYAPYFKPSFYRMTVTNTGWVANDVFTDLLSGTDTTLESDGTLVFASSGTVLDPESLTVVTNIPDLASSSLVRPDTASGLLTFLTPKNGQWWLRQYSHATYGLRGEFRVPSVEGTPKSLIRWGDTGIAFLTSSNQLFLLQPPLAFADVAVSYSAWPNEVTAGQPFDVTLSVSNLGPSFAADTYITNSIPPYTRLLATGKAPGQTATSPGQVVFALGDLASNSSLNILLTLVTTNSTDRTLTNKCTGSNAFTDLQPDNNTSFALFVSRADADRDGMPDYWEVAHGLNPDKAADAALDPDGDGMTNLEEFLGGTDPHVGDIMRILSARSDAESSLELVLQAPAGMGCSLQVSTNLADWQSVESFVSTGTNKTVSIRPQSGVVHSFYRLMSTK